MVCYCEERHVILQALMSHSKLLCKAIIIIDMGRHDDYTAQRREYASTYLCCLVLAEISLLHFRF